MLEMQPDSLMKRYHQMIIYGNFVTLTMGIFCDRIVVEMEGLESSIMATTTRHPTASDLLTGGMLGRQDVRQEFETADQFNMRSDGRHSKRKVPGQRQYEAKVLHHRGRLIAEMVADGKKNVDIAKELGVTPQNVSDLKNSPLVKTEIERAIATREQRQEKIRDRISEISEDAVKTVEEVMLDKRQKGETRLRAAIGILDRAGHAPVQRVQSQHSEFVLTGSDIDRLKSLGINYMAQRQHMIDNGVLVTDAEDVEVEVVDDTPTQEAESDAVEGEAGEATSAS